MHKNNYSLEILVNGRPVKEYYRDGKSFVEARQNTEYTLRFRNNGWKRVLAIFSIDGIEVLKGKAAVQADNGYVVDPFSNIEIKGYRIDNQSVAAFKFSAGANSYAVVVGAETKDPITGEVKQDKSDRNNGVIGVRIFEEDVPDNNYDNTYTVNNNLCSGNYFRARNIGKVSYRSRGCSSTTSKSLSYEAIPNSNIVASASCPYPTFAYCASPDFDTGTKWGQKMEDKVKQVTFKKVTVSTDIIIYYSSRQSLINWGIDFSSTKQIFDWPSAFEDRKQYCKIPPGYKI